MRSFTGLTRYSRWAAWVVVFLYIALIVACICFGSYLMSSPLSWTSIGLMVLLSVFIGTRLRGLNNIAHECTHSSFSECRSDNVALGRLCAAVLTGCFLEYKDNHLSHHAHLGNYDQDRELAAIEKFRLHDPLTPSTILRHIVTPLLGLHLGAYSGFNLSGSDGKFFAGLKIALLLAIGVFTILNPLTSVFFVLLPLYFIFPTINFWTDCLDHAGLVGAEDELEASRNVLAPLPVRLLFFPRNDCYHLVHHLFPKIPARHLRAAHEELCHDPTYVSAATAVRASRLSGSGVELRLS